MTARNQLIAYMNEQGVSPNYQELAKTHLKKVDGIVVVDDSWSTNQPLNSDNDDHSIYDEQLLILKNIFGLMSSLDNDGIEVKYLNHSPKLFKVSSLEQLENYHKSNKPSAPTDTTPLCETLTTIENSIKSRDDTDYLVVILTDGIDNNGQTAFQNKLQQIHNRNKNMYFSLVVVTTNNNIIKSYNKFDEDFKRDEDNNKRLDVKGIYKHEKQRYKTNLSFGDYIMSIILGPLDEEVGNMNDYGVRLTSRVENLSEEGRMLRSDFGGYINGTDVKCVDSSCWYIGSIFLGIVGFILIGLSCCLSIEQCKFNYLSESFVTSIEENDALQFVKSCSNYNITVPKIVLNELFTSNHSNMFYVFVLAGIVMSSYLLMLLYKLFVKILKFLLFIVFLLLIVFIGFVVAFKYGLVNIDLQRIILNI